MSRQLRKRIALGCFIYLLLLLFLNAWMHTVSPAPPPPVPPRRARVRWFAKQRSAQVNLVATTPLLVADTLVSPPQEDSSSKWATTLEAVTAGAEPEPKPEAKALAHDEAQQQGLVDDDEDSAELPTPFVAEARRGLPRGATRPLAGARQATPGPCPLPPDGASSHGMRSGWSTANSSSPSSRGWRARMEARTSKRYLAFEPQGGLSNQLVALSHAAAWALVLDRTLVLPHLLPHQDMRQDMHQDMARNKSVSDAGHETPPPSFGSYEGQPPSLSLADLVPWESIFDVQGATRSVRTIPITTLLQRGVRPWSVVQARGRRDPAALVRARVCQSTP